MGLRIEGLAQRSAAQVLILAAFGWPAVAASQDDPVKPVRLGSSPE